MEDYPKTIIEFRDRFNSEEGCIKYLEQLRWPNGFICPYCKAEEFWRTEKILIKCKNCRKRTSVTAGTIFHDTRKPIRLWFEAMWYITSQKYGTNALGLQRILGLGSYNTAWKWLHRLRRVMVRPDREKLSGKVEVDETMIGGKSHGKRGRGSEKKVLVAIAVEDKKEGEKKEIGRIRLAVIPDASSKSLISFISNNIEEGSHVRTDGWKGYSNVSANNYEHTVLNSNDLVICHLVASLMKRWLMGTYQGAARHQHLDFYLDEYTFRFNRRTSASRGKLFYRIVQQAVTTTPVKGMNIIGKN
jgi:transposase-like protein